MEEMKNNETQQEKVEVEEVEENVQVDEDVQKTLESLKNAVVDVKEGLKESVNKLMDQLDDINLSKETLTNYLNEFTKTVNSLTAKASEKVSEIKNDPKTVEYVNKAKETCGKVMDNENVQKVVSTVSDKAKSASAYASGKYQEFIHDPNVRKTVVGAKEKVSETLETVVESLKATFKKEENEEKTEEKEKEE